MWLAEEKELSSHRIFTFGYNSDFKGAGTNLNIIDFAKDLLFQMLTFSGGLGEIRIPIGRQPIVFVAHSMGGLVVKKAYVLGRNDGKYADVISQTHGIVFLATPHRGAQYAKMLNNILSTAPLGAPPKGYVADLDTHSRILQDINEQFRTVCEGLSLVSFFESLKTTIGVSKAFIVEKDSGVLGYPHETSKSLYADHHTICKFKNPQDGNYICVKNILKMWASKMSHLRPSRPTISDRRTTSDLDVIKSIEAILGVRERAEEELKTLSNKVMSGTCQWITKRQPFVEWIEGHETPQKPKIFWLTGLPAMGKTILASYVANQIPNMTVAEGRHCHFFSSGHQNKRTAGYCLRSIASQLAHTNEEFREQLFALHEATGISFNSQDQPFSVIWEKIFEGIIFKMRLKPFFWILDAVDEADMPSMLLSSLLGIQSLTPIKIFVTSRPMKMPSTTFGSSITTLSLSQADTGDDIRTYVHNAVRDALPDNEQQIREDIIDKVLAKAAGSFLWVRLALETLHDNWHTQDDIRKALTEVPEGMEHLYSCMLEKVESQSTRYQLMAKRILTWAACCWRPLSVAELQVALEPEFTGFVRLQDTIVQICGHFISMDFGKVSLIHVTARDFLLNDREGAPAFIDYESAHEHIASVCLRYLSDERWKRVFKNIETSTTTANTIALKTDRLLVAEQEHPFLGYATCYLFYHVSKSSLNPEHLSTVLMTFLTKYCLSWIEAVALSRDLRFITRQARFLKAYAKRRSRRRSMVPLSLKESPDDYTSMIQLWAVDFIRIVGKFGQNLVQNPSSVHRLVPPFCPRASMIGSVYGHQDRSISVTGLPCQGWDDCLASVSVGKEETATKVLATDAYFLTLIGSSGTIVVWHAETCEEARRLHHGEYVSVLRLNRYRTILATAGTESYRIWDISSGNELYRLPKTTQALTMAIAFGSVRSELVIALDNCSVACYDLKALRRKWYFNVPDQEVHGSGCPHIMSISPDLSKLAVAWRGKPPLVWDMHGNSQRPVRCRVRDEADPLCFPQFMRWQNDGNSLLILCQNTKRLVEWNLADEEQREWDHVKPHEIAISQDGNLLLSSDNAGTMSVWTFPRLNLLYQLVNKGELIRNLAFSPDGQRFYDTRGSICNIWEPDALVRPDEQELDDHVSTGGSSMVTEPVVVHDESSQAQVTALAYGFADKYFCAGREDGTVSIHDANDGRKIRKVSMHSSTSSIIILTWSYSNKYIISGDDSGRILAKKVEMKDSSWSVFAVFDFRVGEPVQQFLLSESERLLLISSSSTDRIWDLRAKRELCCRQWVAKQGRRWIQHPLDKELLIWIDPVTVHTFSWKDLQHVGSVRSPTPEDFSAELNPAKITGNWFGREVERVDSVQSTAADSTLKEQTDPVRSTVRSRAESLTIERVTTPERADSGWFPGADSAATEGLSTIKHSDSLRPRAENASLQGAITTQRAEEILPQTAHKASTERANIDNMVQWVALTHNKQYIVYLAGSGHRNTSAGLLASGLRLEFLSTSDLRLQNPGSLTADSIADLAAQIKRLIGTYQDRIVFLDHDYWLCTWRIDAGLNDVKRHFFLPKDWLSLNALHMAALNAQGTFFCPKHGDVAIVRQGMRF